MESWDVFHSGRLEVLRGLDTQAVLDARRRGEFHDDDLIRPAGSSQPWTRLADEPALAPETTAAAGPPEEQALPIVNEPAERETPAIGVPVSGSSYDLENEEPLPADPSLFEFDVDRIERHADQLQGQDPFAVDTFPSIGVGGGRSGQVAPLSPAERQAVPTTAAAIPPAPGEQLDPEEEDEEVASFTLAAPSQAAVEELDLTAMVDVSFQLILFFLIAATAIYLKTLEIPRPNPDPSEAVAVQPRTLEELESDYILVAIDNQGGFTVDREPVSAGGIVDRLRQARRDTGRTAMLLTAETEALHRYAVVAYDAANAIGLRITIATPPRRG